ncbi:MAG: hypothetical protein MUP63_03860 [Candidatus Nanohaloarchaeota archaeon QJJ-7]|nr:hypothetical protein [Candidatus Nanohaloarchaeota archaeon QJJ-7]
MIQAAKSLVKSFSGKECHVCGGTVGETYVIADVKIPGYTGEHEKAFCSEEHLEEWREHIREWEEKNHEIPMTNVGSACGGTC